MRRLRCVGALAMLARALLAALCCGGGAALAQFPPDLGVAQGSAITVYGAFAGGQAGMDVAHAGDVDGKQQCRARGGRGCF